MADTDKNIHDFVSNLMTIGSCMEKMNHQQQDKFVTWAEGFSAGIAIAAGENDGRTENKETNKRN